VAEAQTAKMIFPTDFMIRRSCGCLAKEEAQPSTAIAGSQRKPRV
jgi:hypothetical protein